MASATTLDNDGGAIVDLNAKTRQASNRGRFLRAFMRNRIAMIGLAIVLVMIFAAVFADYVAPYDPNEPHYTNLTQPPGEDFLLGTDNFGRDILSRLIYGARVSLVIAFIAQTVAITIGVTLGLISGWFGGWVDDVIMRVTDGFFAIPSLMFLIVWVAAIDPNDVFLFDVFKEFGVQPRQFSIFLALGLVGWPADARMMRSQVLAAKEREFVQAARAMGASNQRIMLRHLLPNCIAPSIVLASLGIAGAILTESTLGFLGVGVEIPNPSWGSMVDQGRTFTTTAWWYSVFPGAAIMLTVLGFNFVGDGLRDALDPRLYR